KDTYYSDDETQYTLQGGGHSSDECGEQSDPSMHVCSANDNEITINVKEKFAHRAFQGEKGKVHD
ncbi:hypothetical protein E2562_039328, partial [Oryza meyeriana var. granulata]